MGNSNLKIKKIVFLLMLFLPAKIFACASERAPIADEMVVGLLILISLLAIPVGKIVTNVKFSVKRVVVFFVIGLFLTAFYAFIVCAWFIVRVLEIDLSLYFILISIPVFVLLASALVCRIFFAKKLSDRKKG